MPTSDSPLLLTGHARINRRAAASLYDGHLWVYDSDVLECTATQAGLVAVADESGRALGTAFFSPRSVIRLRMLARPAETVSRDFFFARLQAAWHRRQQLMPAADAWRWVHGEADLLPGIFIDRYADCISLQTTCAGADAFEALLVELVQEIARPRAIVLRRDVGSRTKEGLATDIAVAIGAPPVVAAYHEGELALEVDLLADQKTGSFLDQAQNHVTAARYGRGNALDCFTYHGGFALQLSTVCSHVVACDMSERALVQARRNADAAGIKNMEFVAEDVFTLLPRLEKEGRKLDTIVLDPPAFASSRATVGRALGAYKEINARAMRLLSPGGILVTCSCSGRVSATDFDDMLAGASRKARRRVQILERRGAGPDHPVLAGVPETDYLKCRIASVL